MYFFYNFGSDFLRYTHWQDFLEIRLMYRKYNFQQTLFFVRGKKLNIKHI